MTNLRPLLPLTGKGILVTRPAKQAQALCQLIESYGGNPHLLPTIEISALEDDQLLIQSIPFLDTCDLVIFISANAVLYSYPYIKKTYPQWPSHIKIAAIGQATHSALEKLGLTVTYCPNHFSSEGLLALSEFQILTDKKIMMFTGLGGRELLANTLQQRGGNVIIVPCYQRLLPKIDQAILTPIIENPAIQLNIIMSVESLKNLVALLGNRGHQWLKHLPMVALSERIANFAKTLGVESIIITQQASDEGIIQAILTWFNQTDKRTTP